ncbi:hypothetical protein ACHAPJ_012150 [Fusarium lateritium]
MKFQSAFVFFTAAVSATAPPPTCKGSAPSYCKYTSNRDATECRRLFAKNYIDVATCQLPAKTVTSTRIKRATIVTTKTIAPPARTTKVYKTITKTGKPTTLPTITVTATSTEIDTTVVTDSTTITEFNTVTDTETNSVTNTQTVTSTSTSTTTLPFSDPQSCTRKKRARGVSIPTSCSCFLTATKPAATETIVITKNKPAITHTVYKIGGPRKVISRTIIIIRYASGPTVSAPETTKTSTATITQTDHTTTTITNSQTTTTTEVKDVTDTVTQTKTETATATATKSPCDDIGSVEPINQQISGSVIEITTSKDASGPNAAKSCCQSCYARPNCVQFRVGNGQCDVFSTKPSFSSSCSSPLCPRGFPDLDIGSDDGFNYYLGPCFGTAVA